MYNEHAESDGKIIPIASIDFTTISLEKAASKAIFTIFYRYSAASENNFESELPFD